MTQPLPAIYLLCVAWCQSELLLRDLQFEFLQCPVAKEKYYGRLEEYRQARSRRRRQ